MYQMTPGMRAFAVRRRWNRIFFLTYLAIIWAGLAGSVGLDLVGKALAGGGLHYPLIVKAYGVAFGAWLVLFSLQVLFVEEGSYRMHQRLGITAVVVLPAMLVLGPVAALALIRANPDQPGYFALYCTQLTNVIGSVGLAAYGLSQRHDPSAHKRLMLIGTIALLEPGFSRFWSGPLHGLTGGYWQYVVGTYAGSIVLLIGIGGYDLAMRGRLHPIYLPAVLWCLAMEWLAAGLYYQPLWAAATRHLTGA